MRILLLVIWVSFLVYGDWRIRNHPRVPPPAASMPGGCLAAPVKKSLPHFTATRAMPVNWRLRNIDLAPQAEGSPAPARADYLGKYVACSIAVGDPVAASDLAALPAVPAASGKVLYLFPLSPALHEALNAGNHIDLFQGPHPIVSGALVEAVVEVAHPPGWNAVLQISPPEDQLLKEHDPQNLNWIPRQ